MSKWRITIQYSPVQRKTIKVTGPATAKLAEAAAFASMKWDASKCISVETEPYEPDEIEPPKVIEVAAPKATQPKPSTKSSPVHKKQGAKKK